VLPHLLSLILVHFAAAGAPHLPSHTFWKESATLRRHTRLSIPGGSHFITTVTRARGSWFTHSEHCRHILEIFEDCRSNTQVVCIGYILMPDHLHALLVQPTKATEAPLPISELMRRFKQATSRFCRPQNFPEKSLWQARYDDVPVPGSHAAWTKLNYIHFNPVKRGLVTSPDIYPWSSARDYINSTKGIVSIELMGPIIE
jgi:putative transposase